MKIEIIGADEATRKAVAAHIEIKTAIKPEVEPDKQAARGGPTAGEWMACPGLAGDRYRIETRGTGNDCDPIAECRGPDRKANAQLLASAPELLAALKSAAGMIHIPIRGVFKAYQQEKLDAIRAAIAKAEGGAE